MADDMAFQNKVLEKIELIRSEAQSSDTIHKEAQARMTQELAELTKKVDDAVVAAKRAEAVEEAMKAIETRLAKGPNLNGEQMERSEHAKAQDEYLRNGRGSQDVPMEFRAANEGTAADGGFLVTKEFDMAIAKLARDTNPWRGVATVRSGRAPAIQLVRQTSKAAGGWVSEAGTRSETSTPQLGTTDIVAHELYAKPLATQTILEDAAQIEAFLLAEIDEVFNEYELAAFTNGDGAGKPRGLFTYATAAQTGKTEVADGKIGYVVTGSSGAFGSNPFDNVRDLVTALKPAYLPRSAFMMDRVTMATLAKVKDSTGQYILQPSVKDGIPFTIWAYPVVLNDVAPTIAANSYSISFGDHTAYHIYDRLGTTLLRDPYSSKPFVEFYTRKRVGGGLHRTEKIKFLKFAAS
jgi:HK97 family phage major capsid protein